MARLIGVFIVSAAAIGACWWWLGRPVAMPPSPLAAGEKLQCVSYAPFRGAQNPFDQTFIAAAQIDEDLAQLAAVTGCIRIYSVDRGLDQIPEIAKRHGLKVILGLWVSRFPDLTKFQLDTAIGLANRFPDTVVAVVVGNEVLLRGEAAAATLAAAIRSVRAAIPRNIKVTYADVWEFWLKNRELAAEVDFVTIHILPYWEDFPIAGAAAAAHVADIRRAVGKELPGKDILIGEVGWPSAGRMREGALPSLSQQARVLHNVLAVAKRDQVRVNLIEAFDQPWKRRLEGTVGGHWGLFDRRTRQRKFVWGEPVSDHPQWLWQAIAGIVLAAIVLAAAGLGGGQRYQPARVLLGLGAMAVVAGSLLGLAAENAVVESLGLAGWLHSGVLVGLAVVAPVVGARALTRQRPLPALQGVLARRGERPADRLMLLLGALWIGVLVMAVDAALGLVFDPRYKDFPFAQLTAAALPFVVLAAVGPRQPGGRPAAEVAVAATLAASAVYILFNEGFANWQSIWLCAVFAVLAVTLLRSRDGQS